MQKRNEESSFRDPSGYLYYKNKNIYRQISKSYENEYKTLIKSGLYKELVKKELIIPHKEIKKLLIKPEMIPFISYPYEWCYNQLKDAALTTLKIQKTAIEHGMTLKDASVYNIQFKNGKPILIDTLSFEKYKEGKPWIAYKQFCQHFLAPLTLMAYKDIRLNQLLKTYLDGIPLDLTSKLLPSKTQLILPIKLHIHLHAKMQEKYSKTKIKTRNISKNAILAIIENLETFIKGLKIKTQETEWQDYYDNTNYTKKSFKEKKKIITELIKKIKPEKIIDLGANDGLFSRIAKESKLIISTDIDHNAVEKNYQKTKENKENNILPLIIDITNPSPGIGWENKERKSLIERSDFDLTMALALIHHLRITNNTPFQKIVELLNKLSKWLIIEYVPKEDSNAQFLLQSREDIFKDYNKMEFEKTFKKYFKIIKTKKITQSKRIIYLMKKLKKQ